MKRKAVLDKLKKAAKEAGKDFELYELKNHQGVRVGGTSSTLARHSEIVDLAAHKFWDQFAGEFGGKGWWK